MGTYQDPVSGRTGLLNDISLVAAGARTATFNSPGVWVADTGSISVDIVVTAGSGTTPTLDVTFQTSKDNATWVNLPTPAGPTTQITGVTTQRRVYCCTDRYVRAVCTIGGTTPSFNLTITGEAF